MSGNFFAHKNSIKAYRSDNAGYKYNIDQIVSPQDFDNNGYIDIAKLVTNFKYNGTHIAMGADKYNSSSEDVIRYQIPAADFKFCYCIDLSESFQLLMDGNKASYLSDCVLKGSNPVAHGDSYNGQSNLTTFTSEQDSGKTVIIERKLDSNGQKFGIYIDEELQESWYEDGIAPILLCFELQASGGGGSGNRENGTLGGMGGGSGAYCFGVLDFLKSNKFTIYLGPGGNGGIAYDNSGGNAGESSWIKDSNDNTLITLGGGKGGPKCPNNTSTNAGGSGGTIEQDATNGSAITILYKTNGCVGGGNDKTYWKRAADFIPDDDGKKMSLIEKDKIGNNYGTLYYRSLGTSLGGPHISNGIDYQWNDNGYAGTGAPSPFGSNGGGSAGRSTGTGDPDAGRDGVNGAGGGGGDWENFIVGTKANGGHGGNAVLRIFSI